MFYGFDLENYSKETVYTYGSNTSFHLQRVNLNENKFIYLCYCLSKYLGFIRKITNYLFITYKELFNAYVYVCTPLLSYEYYNSYKRESHYLYEHMQLDGYMLLCKYGLVYRLCDLIYLCFSTHILYTYIILFKRNRPSLKKSFIN